MLLDSASNSMMGLYKALVANELICLRSNGAGNFTTVYQSRLGMHKTACMSHAKHARSLKVVQMA